MILIVSNYIENNDKRLKGCVGVESSLTSVSPIFSAFLAAIDTNCRKTIERWFRDTSWTPAHWTSTGCSQCRRNRRSRRLSSVGLHRTTSNSRHNWSTISRSHCRPSRRTLVLRKVRANRFHSLTPWRRGRGNAGHSRCLCMRFPSPAGTSDPL